MMANLFRIFCPFDTGYVNISFFTNIHWGGDTIFNVVNVDAHDGIGFPGFRVFIGIVRGIKGILFVCRILSSEHIHVVSLHG